jgi:hypothetical protein
MGGVPTGSPQTPGIDPMALAMMGAATKRRHGKHKGVGKHKGKHRGSKKHKGR